MTQYDPSKAEPKWQKKWEEKNLFAFDLDAAKDPYYCLVMFPYPSGARLHVGHWFQYSIPDSYCRFLKMQGKDIFHPMGFDAFGLPAENYAVKTGVPPAKSTEENVHTMIEQYKRMGVMYDWSKSLNSSTSEYYKWTQWLFVQMFKNDLAFKKKANVNFCPKCQTVLANEQVWDGNCERCDTDVVIKPMEQWFWKITDYAERLLDGLKDLDWPEKTKTMQTNWIGKKEGVFITSKLKDKDFEFEVWDSVPQTFCAQTFTVIAPDHPKLPELMKGMKQEKEVLEFAQKIMKKKATKRFDPDEDLEGLFTGLYVDDPFGMGDLPLWVASYVVMEYGSGVVHCSAHDERDFAFAKKYSIPLRPVMFPDNPKEAQKVRDLAYCFSKDPEGVMEQPEKFKGRRWGEVRDDIVEYMEKDLGIARSGVNFRLRDWSIGRQRYWGAPIPIVYSPEGKPHAIPEEHLPWMLPEDVDFKPKGTAPLGQSKELKERTEKIFGKGWTPEIDTMDTFVCSSFYEMRFLTEGDQKKFLDQKREKKWMPVDLYIGGTEHACMHLIYARFVSMALKDFGLVQHGEPFKKLVHQGVITNKGAKMSKSKNNVVSPDAFVEKYGSDIFRMYLMFMGPFTQGGDWSDTGIKGVDRFAKRIWRVFFEKVNKKLDQDSAEVKAKLHWAIKKVTGDIEKLHFNTALSALMECMNLIDTQEGVTVETAQTFAKLLAPMAPHLAEELWERTGGKGFVIQQSWPTYDEMLLVTDTITVAIQVNGKVRGEIEVDKDASEENVIALAKEQENVRRHIEGKKLKRELYVAGKLVSLVH